MMAGLEAEENEQQIFYGFHNAASDFLHYRAPEAVAFGSSRRARKNCAGVIDLSFVSRHLL
jgi:hypothetical protein